QSDSAAPRSCEVGGPKVGDEQHPDDPAERHGHRKTGNAEPQSAFAHTTEPTAAIACTTVTPSPQGPPFAIGDQVQLTDAKGRMHTITLQAGQRFHTEKGGIDHDELI